MVEDAKAGRAQIWESHFLGSEKPYLADRTARQPRTAARPFGFTVIAFPFKLDGGSAGWARVVAIVEQVVKKP